MKKEKSIISRLWEIRTVAFPVMKAQRNSLLGLLMLSVLLTIFELLRPQPIRFLFDALLIPNPDQLPSYIEPILTWPPEAVIAIVALAVLLISGGIGGVNFLLEIKTAYLGNKVISRLRKVVFRHLIVLPNIFHDSQKTGDLVVRLTGDILMMRDLFVNFLVSFVGRIILILGMLIVMALMNWRLTLFVAAFLPLLFWLTMRTTKRVGMLTRKQRRHESEVAHSVHEIIGEMRTFAVYGRSDLEDKRFDSTNRRSFKKDVKSRRERAKLSGITELTLGFGLCLIIAIGTWEIFRENMSAGELLVFISYMRTMYKPIRSITAMVARTGKAVACSERVLDILETPVEIQDSPDAAEAPPFKGHIEWKNIVLTYGGKAEALKHVNLSIEPGSIVGLTGKSGSGKSSLCMLLPRIYDPDEGQILIDGMDTKEITLLSLRKQISLVLQDPGVFDMAIGENVSFGLEDCPSDRIEQACREAELHETIAAMPRGYETEVGERGAFLSGGQRQRLGLARALVRDPKILILDEPFEGLDAPTAEAIRNTILKVSEGRTILIISHHEQHLKGCTHIVEMKNGEVVKYEELTDAPAGQFSSGAPRT